MLHHANKPTSQQPNPAHQLLHDGEDAEGRHLPQVKGLAGDEVVDDVRGACLGGIGGVCACALDW